ncbi:hypothetical protein ACFLR3_00515 [Campylobacterota bacterium]
MSFISFLIGAGVGAVSMKIYMDKANDKCEEQLHAEHAQNVIREEELSHSDNVEITADGTIEIDPTDEEIIISTVKSLKRSKNHVSLAAVARESGLSNYKVSKHKDLIEKLKS